MTLFCITLTCISSDATNVRTTLHHNSLANAEVWKCIFICRVRLIIHVIVIQFPDAQKFKFTIQCFAQHQFSGECSAFGVWGWICSTVNTPAHNLCGSCDLASKINDVTDTGDELDLICFDCALSEPNHITLVSCCLCGYSSYAPILIWWLFLQLSPSPSINCIFQQEDTTVVKKFQHILGLCSSSKQRKLENRYDASNLCMKLEFFISQK